MCNSIENTLRDLIKTSDFIKNSIYAHVIRIDADTVTLECFLDENNSMERVFDRSVIENSVSDLKYGVTVCLETYTYGNVVILIVNSCEFDKDAYMNKACNDLDTSFISFIKNSNINL